MARMSLFITEEGLPELREKLANMDATWGEPIKKGLIDLGEKGKTILLSRVPRGPEGLLAKSVKYGISKAPVPTWVNWKANRTRRGGGKGGRYGYVLNAGFRRSRRGNIFPVGNFLGWFSGASGLIRGWLGTISAQIAREMEARWLR